jgi:YgiT-type zinc finger domain-containing protein
MEPKECPMCGATMRLHKREVIHHVPGSGETRTKSAPEWICPECDYFEDAEES